jgi:hypothetical protein
MIAILHSAYDARNEGARALSVRVLAKTLGLDPSDIDLAVKDPLGKEAAISGHGDFLWIRHRSIADTALQLSRGSRPESLHELLGRLVRAAVALSSPDGLLDADLYAVAYLSSRLKDQAEAVAAAEASVAAAPSRLSYRTSQVSALRMAGRFPDALRTAERAAAQIGTMADPESRRGFLLEWGTAAGQAGHHGSNLLLDGLALRLATNEAQETDALLSLGVALRELHRQTSRPVFLDALRGVVGLVQVRRRTRREDSYLARHVEYLAAQGAKSLAGEEAWHAVQASADEVLPSAHATLVPLLTAAKRSVRPGRA